MYVKRRYNWRSNHTNPVDFSNNSILFEVIDIVVVYRLLLLIT